MYKETQYTSTYTWIKQQCFWFTYRITCHRLWGTDQTNEPYRVQ